MKCYEGVAGGKYYAVQTLEQFAEFYELAKVQPKLVLDTETQGLQWVKHNPCGIVIGWGPANNYYIPIDHRDRFTGGRSSEPQLNWLDIYQRMKVLLENREITTIAHNCLKGDMRIWMADGTKQRIKDLVRSKSNAEVLCVNERTGLIESKPIIGWVEGPLKSWSEWLRIRVSGKGELRLTKDHEVLTARGRVRADEVVVGDKIITAKPRMTQAQKDLVYGSLLGDASIVKQNGAKARSPYFKVSHEIKWSEYARFKATVLGDLLSKVKVEQRTYKGFNGTDGSQMICVSSKSDARLNEAFIVTKNGERLINEQWLKYLTPAALAIWHCDDGTLRGNSGASACTTAQGHKGTDLLVEFLNGNGWPARKWVRPDGQIYIVISGRIPGRMCDGLKSWWETIAPFIPPSMAYKLPPRYRHLASVTHWDRKEPTTAFEDEVVSVEPLLRKEGDTRRHGGYTDAGGKRKRIPQWCLVIEDNHNFFAEGLAVSNCKFDKHMLVNLGINVNFTHDSLISSFLLDENISHALKDLAKLYVDEEAGKWEDNIDRWRHNEAKRRRSELRKMINERAAVYKKDAAYMAEVTKKAIEITGFKLDENGKAEKGAKAKLTRTITNFLVERASPEFKDHLYQKNSKDDISYDFIPLDEMVPYACADVHYTWVLNELFLPVIAEDPEFFQLYVTEMTLLKHLFSIEREGAKIDRQYLESCGPELIAEAARLEKVIYKQLGYEFNISSGDQLIAALEAAGCDLKKLTKGSREKIEKTGNLDFAKYSTDSEVMEELGAKYQFAKDIVDYRRALKIKGTYVDGILEKLDSKDRVHCWFNSMVRTGRLSAKNPNLTNIDGKDSRVKRAFTVPDDDHVMVFMDLSQIELRLTAHESQDPELLACYPMVGKGKDVHSLTCAEVIMGMGYDEFIVKMNDADGHDDNNVICECNQCICDFKRKAAKRVNFGIIYGAGKFTIQRQVSTPHRYVSADECGEYIDGYLNKYCYVKRWIDRVGYQLKRTGSVKNAFGRYRRLPDILVTTDNKYKYRMMRQAVNFLIQGAAADMFKIAINRISKVIEGTGIKIFNIVHDDIQFFWPKDKLDLIPLVKAELERWPELSVPIISDVSISDTNWASKRKYKVAA